MEAPSPQTFPPHWRRNLLRYFVSRFSAHIAFQVQSVAVGWQVYELTNRPLDLGFVGLVQFLPIFIFSIPGGHVADRFSRRRLSILGLFVCMLCAIGLFAQDKILGGPNVYVIYVLLFCHATMRAFSGPANQSLLPDLVPHEEFPKVVAWNSSLWQIAVTVGPLIGGLVYSHFGTARAAYFLASVCMALSFLIQLFLKVTESHHLVRTRDSIFTGLRYVWNNKNLLGCISLDLFAVLLGGAVALLPAYAKDVLHCGPQGLGLLRSAPGLGAALMGGWLALRPIKHGAGKKMFLSVFLFGIATIGFGLSTNLVLSFIFLFITGAVDIVSVVVRGTLVQMKTPQKMRGRVSAVNLVFISASNELGEFESGVTAALFGLIPSVVIGGAGTMVIAVLWSFLFPTLRKLDRLDS